MIGEAIEQTWTCVAADRGGVVDTAAIGERRIERGARFAFREQAVEWLAAQVADGWEYDHGPTPCATTYFGPTDSPSNCWSARVSKPAVSERKAA